MARLGGSVTARYDQSGYVAVWHGETVVSRCEKVLSGSAGFVVAVKARSVTPRLGLFRLGKVRLGGLVN